MPIQPPSRIDLEVAQRIRQRRIVAGLSQETLAAALSVSYQQFQKYERGHNRISAGKLYQVAKALNTPVCWFFGCPCA